MVCYLEVVEFSVGYISQRALKPKKIGELTFV